MEMSEATDKIFTAFAKFQGELCNSSKAKQGHGYKYSDLAECINTAKVPLESNGLAVTQLLGESDRGVTLTTMLTHSSGQWLRSSYVMATAVLQGGGGKNPAQVMGSGITYARRYAYAAILGMAQEDDDAANIQARHEARKPQEKASAEQVKALSDTIEAAGYTVQQVCETWKINSLSDIPANAINNSISTVKGWNK